MRWGLTILGVLSALIGCAVVFGDGTAWVDMNQSVDTEVNKKESRSAK